MIAKTCSDVDKEVAGLKNMTTNPIYIKLVNTVKKKESGTCIRSDRNGKKCIPGAPESKYRRASFGLA